jgi:DNA primase
MTIEEALQYIKTEIPISSIIGNYLNLQKVGKNYRAQCPFHMDSDPSFSVSDEKGIFKCFGCGKSGDAITFVELYEGISFIEAIEKIAEFFNLDVDIKRQAEHGYYKFYKELSEAYMEELYKPENRPALDYLYKRGLTDEDIKTFKIGYAPIGKHLPLEIAKKNNMTQFSSWGFTKKHDAFEGRVIFPIEDINGRVVGFSGRVVGEGQVKYLNSPNTIFFNKSKLLYNFARAQEFIKTYEFAFIVEGFFDVISLWKNGLKNAVAIMGTAFTNEHLYLLERVAKNLIIALDNDAAGEQATKRLIYPALKNDFNVKILKINGAKDLDELAKAVDLQKYIQEPNNIIDAVRFLYDQSLDIAEQHSRFVFLKDIAKDLEKNNLAKFDEFVNLWSEESGLSKKEIIDYIHSRDKKDNKNIANTNNIPKILAEHWYLYWLMKDREAFSKWDILLQGSAELIRKKLIHEPDKLTPREKDFLTNLVMRLDKEIQPNVEYIYKRLKYKEIQYKIAQIDIKLKSASSQERIKLLQTKIDLIKLRADYDDYGEQ